MSILRPARTFTARAVLPGESIAEFETLHGELTAEFAPEGRLERDAVHALAKCLWRKARLDGLTRAEERPEPVPLTRATLRNIISGRLLPRPSGSAPEAQPGGAPEPTPTYEAVMEAFTAEAKFDAQIERLVRRITRLQARRHGPGRRGRPNAMLPAA